MKTYALQGIKFNFSLENIASKIKIWADIFKTNVKRGALKTVSIKSIGHRKQI